MKGQVQTHDENSLNRTHENFVGSLAAGPDFVRLSGRQVVLMCAKAVFCRLPAAAGRRFFMSELLLKAQNIDVSFGIRKILDIKALELYDGDKIGLVGENGAGKTTLLNVLFGNLMPDAGEVRLYSSVRMIAQMGETDLDADGFTGSEFAVREKK